MLKRGHIILRLGEKTQRLNYTHMNSVCSNSRMLWRHVELFNSYSYHHGLCQHLPCISAQETEDVLLAPSCRRWTTSSHILCLGEGIPLVHDPGQVASGRKILHNHLADFWKQDMRKISPFICVCVHTKQVGKLPILVALEHVSRVPDIIFLVCL